jgi:hypothetical protein
MKDLTRREFLGGAAAVGAALAASRVLADLGST